MKRFLQILLALGVIAAIAIAAIILIPVQRTPPTEALAADWQPDADAGRYAMYASDCMACHTAEGGEEFAGRRPIETPVGTIWSANITPDPETGIGGWSLDEFRAALIDGLRPDGSHLYPAMPYENYRMLTEEDIRGLYLYFMEEVPAVQSAVREPDLPFPFNQRWGVRVLNWLTLPHDAGFEPTMGDPVLNRGQYLVEGPGHCGACHSPRTIYQGQDGITASDPGFLTGGEIAGWEAPPLRGDATALRDWTVSMLAEFLQTGRNDVSTANGEMGLVVQHSMQHLTDDDLLAIARYLKVLDRQPTDEPWTTAQPGPMSIPAPEADAAGQETTDLLTSADPSMPLGARLYMDNCAHCHFVTGRGSPPTFPALQRNSLVQSDQVGPLLSIILNGAFVEGTDERPMPLVMQGYAERLDDAEIAELATFVRNAWGNRAGAVSAGDVAEARDEVEGSKPVGEQ